MGYAFPLAGLLATRRYRKPLHLGVAFLPKGGVPFVSLNSRKTCTLKKGRLW